MLGTRSSPEPCRVQAPAAFQDGTLFYEAGCHFCCERVGGRMRTDMSPRIRFAVHVGNVSLHSVPLNAGE